MSNIRNRASLLSKLRHLSEVGQDDATGSDLEGLGREAARDARRRINSNSGKLARSTGSSKAERRQGTTRVRIYSGDDEAFYAWLVEKGHANAEASPYFFPAVRPVLAKAPRVLGDRYKLQVKAAVSQPRAGNPFPGRFGRGGKR